MNKPIRSNRCSTLVSRLLSIRYSILITAALFSGAPLQAAPHPVVYSSAQKEQQRDAGSNLIEKIKDEKNLGRTSYLVPTGTYRFNKTTPVGNRNAFIKLTGMDNFTLDCNDSTFIFEDDRLGIYIGSSVNFTMKRLNVDYDPLPFTQGTIESVGDTTMTIRLDPGYETVTPHFAGLASGISNPEVRAAVVGSDGKFKRNQNLFRLWPFLKNPKNSNGTYTVKPAIFYGELMGSLNAVAGDRIVIWIRSEGAVIVEGCRNVTLANWDIFASPGICFTDSSGYGGNTYRDCNIVRRSGTDRLLAGNSDGFHSVNTEKGPLIESADIHSIGDDAVNIHGTFSKVLKVESPTSIVVAQIAWRGHLPQYNYDFVRGVDSAQLGRKAATATRFDYNDNGTVVPAHRLVLQGTSISGLVRGDIVTCTQFVGNGATVRNNNFTNILTRGILYRSSNGTITGNVLNWIGLYGIALLPHPGYWGESMYCENVNASSNTLNDTYVFGNADNEQVRRAAIYAYAPGCTIGSKQKNLTINNNKINRTASHGICVEGASTVSLLSNGIHYYGNSVGGAGIKTAQVTGLTISGNSYTAGYPGGDNYINIQ